MNEGYSGSAAGQGQSVDAQDGALLGRARIAGDEPDRRPRDIRVDPHALTHRDKRFIAISMMLPVFLGSVDQSILASALPTIGRDLGEVHHMPWLITAFLIASTALTPLYGKFADIHGRRAAMLIGVTVYMAGSLVCAASPNMLTLIFGRIAQGCGAGGLTVTANMATSLRSKSAASTTHISRSPS
jgi:MFS family permease